MHLYQSHWITCGSPNPPRPLPPHLGALCHTFCLPVNFVFIRQGCASVNSFGKSVLNPPFLPFLPNERLYSLWLPVPLNMLPLACALLQGHDLLLGSSLPIWPSEETIVLPDMEQRLPVIQRWFTKVREIMEEDPKVILLLSTPGRTCDLLLNDKLW